MLKRQIAKIIATIGPKTANSVILRKMYKAGMSVARLNGSHNTLKWHKKTIDLINTCLPKCPILLDIPVNLNLNYFQILVIWVLFPLEKNYNILQLHNYYQ